jgi:hypothetical protein
MINNINIQIVSVRISLESSIAHNISQNLTHNHEFDINAYLKDCAELFTTLGIDEKLVEEIIDEGKTQGLMEYTMGMIPEGIDSGAQIVPTANPRLIMGGRKLVELLAEFNRLSIIG